VFSFGFQWFWNRYRNGFRFVHFALNLLQQRSRRRTFFRLAGRGCGRARRLGLATEDLFVTADRRSEGSPQAACGESGEKQGRGCLNAR
ncbi:hypothetical protein, partial [Acinetobacter baumannii]|uniref:hypothetical protein n=1 Tax=Acinetobacter baumannii TaxID=470 RepID=UPI001BB4686C